jgi:hypothetical protein
MLRRPSQAVQLFGTEEPVPLVRELHFGALTVQFDAGNLRYIKWGDLELLRGIAFLVRDQDWGTYSIVMDDLEIDESAGAFRVAYSAHCSGRGQALRYDVDILGQRDGSLTFEASIDPETDFLTQRTGFIVLHPRGIAGEALEVVHTDGSVEQARFPELISPHQPFGNIRQLRHAVASGVWVRVLFQGDVFEMEDQRNWMDASFKTYVRPLAEPRPYLLCARQNSRQVVKVVLEGNIEQRGPASGRTETIIKVGDEIGKMPRIGIAAVPEDVEQALAVIDVLRSVGVQRLVGQLDLRRHSDSDLEQLWRLSQSMSAGLALQVILGCERSPEEELSELGRIVEASGALIESLGVSPAVDLKTDPPRAGSGVYPLERIYAAARAVFGSLPLGGGSFAYFAELNRKRPPMALLDFVTHATCSTVHAADDVSVAETLETLPDIIRSTRAFTDGRAYWLGPSAVGMRYNPYGAAPADNPDNRRIPMAKMDPRQRGLFAAAYNLGYLAHAVRGGIDAVALSAPSGEFGLAYRPTSYAQPWFDTHKPLVYPLYHVIRTVARAAGAPALATDVSDGRHVQAVAYQDRESCHLLLANLSEKPRWVRVSGVASERALIRALDSESFVACVSDPAAFDANARPAITRLELQPYAFVQLTISG